MKKAEFVKRMMEKVKTIKISNTIRNAGIMAGISFFSSLAATHGFSMGNIYAGLVAGGLTFFIEWAHQLGIRVPIRKKGQVSLFFNAA